MPAFDCDECLARRFDVIDEGLGEAGGRGEVLGALDHEDRHRDSAGSAPGREQLLRHEPFGTQVLPIEPVVHVMRRVPGRGEPEPQHARDEGVRPFEQVRPPALDLVTPAVLSRRPADLLELANGACVTRRAGLGKQRIVGYLVLAGQISAPPARFRRTRGTAPASPWPSTRRERSPRSAPRG